MKRPVAIFTIVLIAAWVSPALAREEERMGLELKWAFNTSDQFPGKSFGSGHMSPPTVWDIDGDGVKEVLWGTRRGDSKRLWCIEGDGSFQWTYPPIENEGLPGDPTSKVSLVDVDNDGVYELCFAGRGGRLHVLNPDGSVKWTWDEPNIQNMHGSPQAFDVDGDGYVEFFLNTNNGFIHCLDHLGNLVWTSAQAGKGNQGQVTVCDVDRDGSFEVLWASNDFNVYCYDAARGVERWKFDSGANQETNQIIVADTDGDMEYEVLTWNSAPSSSVIVINSFGNEIRRWR